jgi:hypothetical protein
VVLFLDEIDALLDESLLSVQRQLRSGYVNRPEGFPQSMARDQSSPLYSSSRDELTVRA